MDSKLRNISIFSAIVIMAMIPAFIFGYGEFQGLLGKRAEHHSLKTLNSSKGLELIAQIDLFKRLTANDLQLIEHIARTELGMVREDELIFVSETADGTRILEDKAPGFRPAFRFLSEDEFDDLLNIDLKAFDFYEELPEFEKPVQP